METKLFRKGIPTDADCKLLNEHFPVDVLTPGTRIGYDLIESLLKINRRSHRFTSVTFRWRTMLERDSGIILKAIAGDSFVVADNTDKCQMSCQKSREAARKAKRAMQISAQVDRNALPDDMKRQFDANNVFAAAVIGLKAVKKQVELPTI